MRVIRLVAGGLGVLAGLWLFTGGAGLVGLLPVVVGGALLWRELATPSRPCPRCGKRVEVGKLDCAHCGFDFRQIGRTQKPA
jgi:hypothetical protein